MARHLLVFKCRAHCVQHPAPARVCVQDPSQTVYVWFDALNGYLSGLLPEASSSGRDSSSASSNGSEASTSGSNVDAALSSGWPADVHVIGKDILRFHAVYWPGMLLSAGLPLPKRVGACRAVHISAVHNSAVHISAVHFSAVHFSAVLCMDLLQQHGAAALQQQGLRV